MHTHSRLERCTVILGTAAVLSALVSTPLCADTVILDNGKELEGRVSDDGTTVTIELAQGVVKIAKSRVVAIEPKITVPDEFAQRSADIRKAAAAEKLSATEQAERWFELSQWAAERNLQRYRDEALKKTVELNPDHARARSGLGFVKHDGAWITLVERNQRMGLVLHEGRWVPREAREEARRAKEEREQKERDDEADIRRKEAETEKLEAERRLIESQRAALEAERSRPRYVYTSAPLFPFYADPCERTFIAPQPRLRTPIAPWQRSLSADYYSRLNRSMPGTRWYSGYSR
ncbi:MAG TPA: hypothetical protein VEK08_15010 [Planctomycetota bacterium]|nr:hypothetical protein [Planctomycetota bacterium]